CKLGTAIADFQVNLAKEIYEAWHNGDGHYDLFANAGGGNRTYYDAADATAALFGALTTSLEVATNSDGDGYLTLEQNGRKVVPFFFRLEDLNSALDQFRGSSNANILDNVKVEVATLDQILGILRSSDACDGDLVERIRLIPSVAALEYVRGLQEGALENAPGEADRPTEGAGALAP
ncbi:MAG: Tic22 family protein, partial [Cyanobacteria bacterium P01_F01_bin.153]